MSGRSRNPVGGSGRTSLVLRVRPGPGDRYEFRLPVFRHAGHAPGGNDRLRCRCVTGGPRRIRGCRGHSQRPDAVYARMRRTSAGAGLGSDQGQWRSAGRCGSHRHPEDGRPRGRDDGDPPGLRRAAAGVRRSQAPPLPGARRQGVVCRPHPRSAESQPRYRVDDAAGGLQTVVCRALRRRFRPEGCRRREPHPPPGHGAWRHGLLRGPARGHQ